MRNPITNKRKTQAKNKKILVITNVVIDVIIMINMRTRYAIAGRSTHLTVSIIDAGARLNHSTIANANTLIPQIIFPITIGSDDEL